LWFFPFNLREIFCTGLFKPLFRRHRDGTPLHSVSRTQLQQRPTRCR
jgi:hypothetical protein